MIVVLLNTYLVILFLLVKLNIVRFTLFWKASPFLVLLLLLVGLFIPMGWGAPQGSAVVVRNSVAIVPDVAGEVIDVPVTANTPLKAGDVLFKIDPTPYDAQVKAIQAQLKLSATRLAQMTQLFERESGGFDVEQRQSEVDQLKAQLEGAQWNLDKTTVRAPVDGYVTNLALRKGARVANLPLSPVMAFIDTSNTLIGVELNQIDARYVAPGQAVEVTFKYLPGRVFTGKVETVLQAIATGQVQTSGLAVQSKGIEAAPFVARIRLDDAALADSLPAGSTGTAAIFTDRVRAAHVIRIIAAPDRDHELRQPFLTVVGCDVVEQSLSFRGERLLSTSGEQGVASAKPSPLVGLPVPEQPALRLIYDTAPIGLAVLSPDCRYLHINQRLTEICGVSVEDHLGRTVRDCVPGLADAVEDIVRSIMETGDPVTGIEVAGQRADQIEERWWVTYWHPLRNDAGDIVGINVAAEEVTERKRAVAALQAHEKELRNARDAAEAALRHLQETQELLIEFEKLAALGRLVAGVAHEVNSPVGTSLTIASSLQSKTAQFAAQAAQGNLRRSSLNNFLEASRKASTELVANLNHAAELVQSFKQVAIDRSSSNRRIFDLGDTTTQAIKSLRAGLRDRGLTVLLDCPPNLTMNSYPGPYGQMLSNIVLNSMTHGFPDGREGTIGIQVRAAGDEDVEIRFSDDGCGMSAEIRHKAFDPFFTTRRDQGCTGLGLHIVHTIVTNCLGGQVSLDSEPDEGTKISIIVPRVAPAAVPPS